MGGGKGIFERAEGGGLESGGVVYGGSRVNRRFGGNVMIVL